ncbi:glycoside hydrolase family 99-like domain-containing protein [Gorillibacterium sp. sgz500922]|uniref:glycoside hydrolase family 99-like domain-containing protein n=1 Tax=Gorillibacterium sp. sgz500922 TaxID=3446694 RepID=UPI003F6695FB
MQTYRLSFAAAAFILLASLFALPFNSSVVRPALADAGPGSRASAPAYEIGAFYFPVWNEQMAAPYVKNTEMVYGRSGDPFGGIKDHLTSPGPWGYGPFPDREPLLGWYDDREQTVMDTHILQASSRGLGHFAFYYYWKDAGGGEKPAQTVRRFQSSAYKDLMDFYIYMVATGSWPASDWNSKIVPSLIEFMRDPAYQRNAEGRPVIGFYGDFASRLGGKDAWARALTALRTQAQAAGLPEPLILLSGSSSPAADEAFGADGYLPLNYSGAGLSRTLAATGISAMTDYSAYTSAWPTLADRFAGRLLIPGGLSGFDPRPWRGVGYGDSAAVENVAYSNASPAKFRKQLDTVKQYLARHPESGGMATFYAWNEWGEGGAIEPSTLYGFGYLNALQEAFGLSNAAYTARVARDGLASLDPALRLEAAPDSSAVAAGQSFGVAVRATNRSPKPMAGLSVKLDAADWSVSGGSAGASVTLAPGETKLFTFRVKAGAGADYAKHALTVQAASSAGTGTPVLASEATFVVKTPAVSAALERVSQTVQAGDTVPLALRLTTRLAADQTGQYRIEAPAGWTVTGGAGAYALPAGSDPRSTVQRLSVTVPRGTPAGQYELRWTLAAKDGGRTVSGTLQLRVGNALQNAGFELPGGSGTTGAPAYWFGLTGKETLSAAVGRDGTGSAERIAADGSNRGIGQEWLDLLPGRSYIVEAWVKVEAGALSIAQMDVDAGFRTNLGFSLKETIPAGDWRKVSFTVRPKSGAAKASLRFLTASEGRNIAYIDDVVFRLAD